MYLFQSAWRPYKRRLGQTHAEEGLYGDAGRRQHLHAKASGGTSPANTLILDFQSPESGDNRFMFKLPNLWGFAAAAPAD